MSCESCKKGFTSTEVIEAAKKWYNNLYKTKRYQKYSFENGFIHGAAWALQFFDSIPGPVEEERTCGNCADSETVGCGGCGLENWKPRTESKQ